MNFPPTTRQPQAHFGAGMATVFLLALTGLLFSSHLASSQTIDTNTGSGGVSGQVQQNGPVNFGGGQWHVKNAGTTTTRKGYVRFDTSSISSTVTAASFDLVVSLIDAGIGDNDQVLNVYGLTDETQDGWDPGTLSWNTAPGNDTASKFEADPTETTLLGTITLDFNGDKAAPVGTVVSLNETSLVNFLNADTNGQVTFIIGRTPGTGDGLNLLFAGDTNGSLAAPTLTVTAEADTTPPSIISLDPADDSPEVLLDSNLTATFDEAIVAGTGFVTLKRASDDSTVEVFDVATSPLLDIGASSSADLIIDPTSDLVSGEEYYIEIDATAIQDSSSNAFAGLAAPPADPNWSFTGDATAPLVAATSPADDATNVTTTVNLVATFNEEVVLGTSGSVTIINLTNPGSVEIELGPDPDGTLAVSGTDLTIDPAADLMPGDEYVIEISAGVVEDLSGNPFAGLLQTDDPNWSFTTDNTPPATTGFGPMADATDVPLRDCLSLVFDEGLVLGTGNITIHLASDNSVVETIDGTSGLVTVAGDTVSIDPSLDLAHSTDYYINIEAGAFKDLSGNDYAGILDTTTWAFTTVAFDPTLLFADNFNRPNSSDLNAKTAGQSGILAPLTWSTGTLESTIDILNNSLRINNDDGDGNDGSWAWLEHNFTGLTTFTVTMDITQQSSGGNGRYVGFRIGQSLADISGEATAALSGNAADVGVYLDTVGATRGIQVWEGSTSLGYVTGNVANLTPGVLSATFTFADMNAGTTLDYEVFLDGVSQHTGSTTWSGTDENYISLQSNSTNNTLIDSFEVRSDGTVEQELMLSIASSGGLLDFSWNSTGGMQYDLVSSTDPEAEPDPSAWAPYNDGTTTYENLLVNSLTGVALTDPTRFFALLEKPVGPIESWDFEADNGGFSATGSPDDWAWGAPNSDNGFLPVNAGNGGSTNAWATNLGPAGTPSGGINTAANSILRSPNIDLTGVTGAELNFAAAIDAFDDDTVEIIIRNAVGDAQLGAVINPFTVPLTATWADYGPFSLAAGAGNTIYLEFRYQGTDGTYIGLYLDDVVITPTAP